MSLMRYKVIGKYSSARYAEAEYCCQISSKSINVILSYTVSTLVRFLRHSVVTDTER